MLQLVTNIGAVNHSATIQLFHEVPICLVGAQTTGAAAPRPSLRSPRQ
ncbi:MAG: hypothetical protein H9535_05755 [Ignavibacteria bacterium]|nr:hypothetical protein [Ignavibacteria bacterium]